MPLYFLRPAGFYISGGDWSDPNNWTDEKGQPTNAVPTGSDDVYVTGSVTGSGVAANITVGTLSEIGGTLIKARPAGFYISGGDWSDPANWTDENGNPKNAVPTGSDDVYVTGSVTGSGVAANITVGTLEEIGWALGISEACCCDKCGKCCWRVISRFSPAECPGPKATVLHGSPPGLRLDFSDSGDCGGPCPDDPAAEQYIDLETIYETTQPVTLNVNVEGLVETVNIPFDTITVSVNGAIVLELEAYDIDPPSCKMLPNSGSGSIELEPGCHIIRVSAGTRDGFWHVGFYYEVTFSVSGGEATDTCDTKICNTYDCDPVNGCQPNTGGSGEYINLAECEANCETPKGYYCNEYQGCREATGSAVVYSSLEDCQNSGVCASGFACDIGVGCINKYGAPSALYTTEAECNAACFLVHNCAQWGGCSPTGGYSDDPTANLSQSACQEICLERYECDAASGCTFIGYGTTGYTVTECPPNCSIQSYLCDYNNNCAPRYDTSGNFSDQSACAAVCFERAVCNQQTGCEYVGYGTDGLLNSDCAAECGAQSYSCDVYYGGCMPLYNDASGEFATEEGCLAACLLRYECQYESYYYYTPMLTCVYLGYGTTGQTQEECTADCVAQSYNCDANNGCTPLLDNTGAYTTSAECSANCVLNYTCFDYGGGYQNCEFVGYQAGGADYETCMANCPQQMQMQQAPDIQAWLDAAKDVQAAPNNTAEYQRYFVSSRPVYPPKPLEEEDPDGPGTMLSGMLEKIGIKSSPTCSCKARARIMNANGNDWCAENLDLITGWLREEAQKRKLPFVDFAGRLLIKRAISLSRAAKSKNEQK